MHTSAYSLTCEHFIEGALWDLHTSAMAAKGFRRSWLELDAYLLNILRVCDAEGELDKLCNLTDETCDERSLPWKCLQGLCSTLQGLQLPCTRRLMQLA